MRNRSHGFRTASKKPDLTAADKCGHRVPERGQGKCHIVQRHPACNALPHTAAQLIPLSGPER